MARKGTLGYKAEQARRKGQRRLEQLNKLLSSTNTSERLRNWASAQKREITSAMQGTRSYSKEGKRYKSKTAKYIEQQISRLTTATEAILPNLSNKPTERMQRVNAFTQKQMNLASLRSQDGASSIYTREQVSVFYAVTRNIWEKPGIKLEDRNAAILQYFNEERMLQGLKHVTLEDIMTKIVERNDVFLAAMNATSTRKTGNDEYDSMVKETMSQQNEREKEGSPTSQIPHLIMEELTNQIYASLNVPNPADI